ncbi:LuxR C-terminal-related transcriptional regulator [Chitinophaga sp. RCC_12]|uniref:helix-turn-helix transcriptional regulator n=1 Tax=Chitinophaga sp. RCC_12 TaxID=3239226 RepID=UPI0035249FCE
MTIRIYEETRKVWNILAERNDPPDLALEMEVHKKVLSFFQVGACYYFIFNAVKGELDFMHPGVYDVLGYNADECTITEMMSRIHPEDVASFLEFEQAAVDFFSRLPPEKVLKYKVRYDLRVRKANGEYVRLLQQSTCIQHDETGAVLRSLCVHTDITHLKPTGHPVLSFIGLEGEPSFTNVEIRKTLTPSREVLTKREKEILRLVLASMPSREIAIHLNISKLTVDKHRKNMLKKTGIKSAAELVVKAVKEGWV